MDIERLRHAIRGSVITRWDPGYDATRETLIWNGRKPGRRPQVIVKAADVHDVRRAVRFAATEGVSVSPRTGGHNFSGVAAQDGIVLDLSRLDHLRIDAEARVAEAGPAVTNRALTRAAGERGLAFPTGHCGSVPLGGYLLGGGVGWNSGQWGVACFSVESADIVTADGAFRRASETENPDLFWAARGAGPEFFGVVVGWRLRLKPLPRAITTRVWIYPLVEIDAAERWMTAAMAEAPVNLELTAALCSAPPPLAARSAQVVMVIATVFAETEAEAEATLGRLAALAPESALDAGQPMPTPLDVLYDVIGGFFPEGARYAVDSFWGHENASGLLRALAEGVAAAPASESFALGLRLPPGRPALGDAAFSMSGARFAAAYAIWRDEAEDAANLRWLRDAAVAAAAHAHGAYAGEADLDLPERRAVIHSPEARARLEALRAAYDPHGLFRRSYSTTDAEPVGPAPKSARGLAAAA